MSDGDRVCSRPGKASFTNAAGRHGPALLSARRLRARRAQPRDDAAARRLGRHGPERQRHAARPSGRRERVLPRPRRPPGRHDARAHARPTRWRRTRRCTRPTRTGRAPPTAIFATLDDEDAEHQVAAWARALQSVDAANADVLHLHHLTPLYEAAARVAPRGPDRRPPARHRAADARGDRARPEPLAVRPGLGRADARLGGPLRADHRAVRDPGRARRAAAADRARALRADPERLRPRQLHARATSSTARCGSGMLVERAARLGARRRAGLRSLLRRRDRRGVLGRHAARRPCCSTSAASPRSSGSRC